MGTDGRGSAPGCNGTCKDPIDSEEGLDSSSTIGGNSEVPWLVQEEEQLPY